MIGGRREEKGGERGKQEVDGRGRRWKLGRHFIPPLAHGAPLEFLLCILCRPFPCNPIGFRRVLTPLLGNLRVQWIIRIRRMKKQLNRQTHLVDLKGWTPFILQYIQAYPSHSIDIRMVDLGEEVNLGWHHGIVLRKEKLQTEHTTLETRILWSLNGDVKMSWILCMRDSHNARSWPL